MAGIIFLTEAIYCNILRSNYFINEKYFPFLFFKKKETLIAEAFLNLRNPNNVVR